MNKSIDESHHESEVILENDRLPDEIDRISMKKNTSRAEKVEVLDQSQMSARSSQLQNSGLKKTFNIH